MIGTKRDPAKNENTGLNSILKNLLCNADVTIPVIIPPKTDIFNVKIPTLVVT